MPTTPGFLARQAGGLMRGRTLVAGSGMAITNTVGEGNPSLSLAPQIAMASNVSGGTLNVATQTVVAVTFNHDDYNPNSIHNTGLNPSRFTAQLAGKYQFVGGVSWTASAGTVSTGLLLCAIAKNGTIVNGSRSYFPPIGLFSTNGQGQNVSIMASLAVNDYLELVVYQDQTGAGATLTLTLDSCAAQTMWVSP